jgi:hypothetical protein
MANNIPNQKRPRWTHSELASLTLYYNQGMPIEEIARRMQRTVASVACVINNRRSTLSLNSRHAMNSVIRERKKLRQCILNDVVQTDMLVIARSIIQINESYFQARIWIGTKDLTTSQNVTMAEFNNVDACYRWFDQQFEKFVY